MRNIIVEVISPFRDFKFVNPLFADSTKTNTITLLVKRKGSCFLNDQCWQSASTIKPVGMWCDILLQAQSVGVACIGRPTGI